MESIEALEQGVRVLTTTKYLLVVGITLTLYDYLLMLDDEIRYMWGGRKSSIFYLYILNRFALIAFRLWEIYAASGPKDSDAGCVAAYRAGVLLVLFFLTSSDVFITLRIYAVTFRNKILAVYFGVLALTKLAVSLASFVEHVTNLHLPSIPLDVFNLCAVFAPLPFRLVPIVIGTVFDVSAFLAIAWCTYRNMPILKLSAVVRTIVTEATIYFLAMLAVQIYIQLSFVLIKDVIVSQQYSYIVYGIVNPVLTMRFALSLKRSAEPGYALKSVQFSSVKFGGGPSSGSQIPVILEGIEMDQVHSSTANSKPVTTEPRGTAINVPTDEIRSGASTVSF